MILDEFLAWWLKYRVIKPPLNAPLNFDGVLHGVVLFRDTPWQVQLFTVPPNAEIPDHVHPNVDSFEVYLAGEIAFRHRGITVTPREMWGDPSLFGKTIRVRPDDPHGGSFGPAGGAFLSVQHWLHGVEPSSVGNDWAYASQDQRAKAYA
jgi:hypothetical protein